MRTLIGRFVGLGLLVGLAVPAGADVAPRECAAELLSAVRAERFRLEGETTKSARAATRAMAKGEKVLGKMLARYDADPVLDHKKLALFTKAGQWIGRALDTGAVSDTAAPVTGWDDCYAAWMVGVDDFVNDAIAERDRLLSDKLREKVSRRLDKGLALYDVAGAQTVAIERARLTVKAMVQIEIAFAKATKLCTKESEPGCPAGLSAENQRLTHRGRRPVTVFDMEWHLTLRTREGVELAPRDGMLSSPGRILPQPLPWTLTRGDSLDALSIAGIPLGFGHRIDGVVTWRTSAGDIDVAIHIDQ